MKDVFAHILELLRAGGHAVLVTIIEVSGSAPRHAGSKMVVHADGTIFGTIGGGKLEADAIQAAVGVMGSTDPTQKVCRLTEDEGVLCGGTVALLLEPLGNQERLIVFGAGHIGQALVPLAARAGFGVTVVDNRPEFASAERFPDAERVVVGPYDEVLTQLRFDPHTYIVIVTHGHTHDAEVLRRCIDQPSAYLGMIGSRHKVAAVKKHLEEQGVAPDRIAAVHAPVGLAIGAETPFEIAVSILAQMIAVRRGAGAGALSMTRGAG
jgi:xanthine dehydrogenase accessory factor